MDEAHALDRGWQGRDKSLFLANLLETGITIVVTVDRNVPYQQNTAASGLIVIVLDAAENRLVDLQPLIPEVRKILQTAQPGRVYRTGA